MKQRLAAALLLVLAACGRTDRHTPAPTQAVAPFPAASDWSWHPMGGLAVIEGEVAEPTELILEGQSIKERRFAETGPVRWEFFRPPPGEAAVLRTSDGRVLARFEFSTAPSRPTVAPAESGTPRLARQPGPATAVAPPAQPPAPAPPEARPPAIQAEAHLRNLPVPSISQRKSQAWPEPSVPPEPPPRTWAEARLRDLPVPTIPQRKSPTWPVPVTPPEPPAPATRTEARLGSLPITPIPGRKPVTIPSAAEAPLSPLRRASKFSPVLAEPVAPVPARPAPAPASLGGPLAGPGQAWPGMGEALNLTRGPAGNKRILLSFDGGSSAEVATQVLDLLKARGVRTTLFLTGTFIQRYPALVRRMAAEGHELGNHTMNHPHFAPGMKRDPKWTRERIQRELLDADAALVRLLGRPMDPFWRAPYGEHTAEIRRWAEELGYRHVGWSEGADTLDWAGPKDRRLYRSGEAIVARLEKRLGKDGDGLIVLMHLGSARELGDRPTEGLGAFIDRARREGWSFVSAGTIVRDLGKPVWDPHQRLALLGASHAQSR